MGKVPHTAEQAPGHTRRAARTACNLARALRIDIKPKQARSAGYYKVQLIMRVEVQPHRNAEPVTQRRGQQALPRGCANQRERRQIDPHASGSRPFTNDEVKRAVLHRGIEHFFNDWIKPVDLVDEQHVMRFQIGEQRGEIARLGDHRAGGCAESHPQLICDDLRQSGLAQPGRAEEQRVIHRLAARFRGLYEDFQIIARTLLPDEFAQALRAQRRIGIVSLPLRRMEGDRVSHLPASL